MLWRGSDESLPDVNMQANRVECKLVIYYFLREEGVRGQLFEFISRLILEWQSIFSQCKVEIMF